MTSYRLTPAAQQDVSSIWDYTQEPWDVQQAEKYVGEIRAAIERVAAGLDRRRACDDIRPGYRRYAIGSHVIYYRDSSDAIDVSRVRHQRMEPRRHP